MQKITANIHLNHIRRNAKVFLELTGKPLCAVVKANAYGHGAVQVVNALEGLVDCFAVALLDEAIEISTAACGRDILIFTPPLCETDVLSAGWHNFILTVDSEQTARLVDRVANEAKMPVRAHVKVNTGMNRYGMNAQSLGKVCRLLKENAYVRVEGLYSHIYGDTLALAEQALQTFLRMQDIAKRYFPHLLCHLSATYGALLGKEYYLDMTRIGIGLYGYLPSGEKRFAPALHKAMSVYAPVVHTRRYTGGGAGYGKPLQNMPKDGCLSVVRCGYADGFLRQKQNGTMDAQSHANAWCMDAHILEGRYKKGTFVPIMLDADKTARSTQTIPYEVLCAATRRAQLVYDWE